MTEYFSVYRHHHRHHGLNKTMYSFDFKIICTIKYQKLIYNTFATVKCNLFGELKKNNNNMVTVSFIKIKLGIDNTIYYIIIFLKAIGPSDSYKGGKGESPTPWNLIFLYFVLNVYILRVANFYESLSFFRLL